MTAAVPTFSHCVKSVRIPSYSGPHFPAFGLNTLRIQSACGEIWTRITPNTDTFHAASLSDIITYFQSILNLNYIFSVHSEFNNTGTSGV